MSNYNELLDEMLKLAGIPLNEKDDEKVNTEIDKEDVKKYQSEPDESTDSEDEKDNETDEELVDKWDASIDSTGKVEVEFHESAVTVNFKDRENISIDIPNTLRNDVDKVSKLFNKIMSYIERVS